MLPALVNSLHGMAIRFGDKPEVYLVLRGMKKHIVNPDVFFSLFRSWNDVFVLDPKLEDQVPNGEAITDLKVYSLGLADNRPADAGFLVINDRSCYPMEWNLLAHYNEEKFYDWSRKSVPSEQYMLSSVSFEADMEDRSECWMSFLKDDVRLSEVSIPGTHDSATYNTHIGWAKCQYSNSDIVSQLKMGVRYFDLRVDENMMMVHGVVSLDISFKRVLKQLIRFLSGSEEFVVVRLKAELSKVTFKGTDELRKLFIYEMFGILADYYMNYFVDSKTIMENPEISKLRGKIVIIDDMYFSDDMTRPALPFGIGIDKRAIETQDAYKNPGKEAKLQRVQGFYQQGEYSNKIRINHVSAVGIPEQSPWDYAEYLNPRVKSYLNTSKLMKLGITAFDYVDRELCKSVFVHNRFAF